MKWIMLAYLILNPLFFMVDFDQRCVQQIFFQLSSVTVFSLGLFFRQKELKFSKLNASIGILMIAFIFAWLRNLQGWNNGGGLNLLLGIMVYITVIKTMDKKDTTFVLRGLGIFTAFCVVILALQVGCKWDYRGARPLYGTTDAPSESIFFQRSAMGMYFAQIIPSLFAITPLSILFLFPMLWSESSAAFGGAFIGILFFMWHRKRIMFWVMIGVFIILSTISYSIPKVRDETLRGVTARAYIFPTITQDIVRFPLGHGLDSFANPPSGLCRYYVWTIPERAISTAKEFGVTSKEYPIKLRRVGNDFIGNTEKDQKIARYVEQIEDGLTWFEHPHNEYLWLGYEVGVHAWVILGFIVYFIWQRFKFSRRDVLTVASMSVLIIYATESMLQFPFHLSRVACFFPFILGVFYIATED